MIIANISLQKNNGFLLKFCQKVSREIARIEYQKSIFFSAFEGHIPLRHPRVHASAGTRRWRAKCMYKFVQTDSFSLQCPNIYNSSGKGIKIGKVGGIDIIIANILLQMNNHGFSVKYWQKLCTKLRKLRLKIAFFRHPLFTSMAKDFSSFVKGIKTEKVRGIDLIIYYQVYFSHLWLCYNQ